MQQLKCEKAENWLWQMPQPILFVMVENTIIIEATDPKCDAINLL